jgi:hypothetical protein
LEAAHIIPFSLAHFSSDTERHRLSATWVNIYRCFPDVRSRLNFCVENINDTQCIMEAKENWARGCLEPWFVNFTIPSAGRKILYAPANFGYNLILYVCGASIGSKASVHNGAISIIMFCVSLIFSTQKFSRERTSGKHLYIFAQIADRL